LILHKLTRDRLLGVILRQFYLLLLKDTRSCDKGEAMKEGLGKL
jgi:hypothetical protein